MRKEPKYPVVTKTNDLIEAKYSLTQSEQKLVLACISFLDSKNQKDFKTIEVKGSDLYNMIGGGEDRHWRRELKVIFEGIGRKPMWITDPSGGTKSLEHWVILPKIYQNEDKVTFIFPIALKPYLLEVNNIRKDANGKNIGFTKFELRNVIKLKKPTSIRIYELLKQYQPLRERTVSFEDFKEMVGSTSKDRYSVFAERYLKPAQKELEEHADITFEFEGVRSGRKVTEILFKPIKVNEKNRRKSKTTKVQEPTIAVEVVDIIKNFLTVNMTNELIISTVKQMKGVIITDKDIDFVKGGNTPNPDPVEKDKGSPTPPDDKAERLRLRLKEIGIDEKTIAIALSKLATNPKWKIWPEVNAVKMAMNDKKDFPNKHTLKKFITSTYLAK